MSAPGGHHLADEQGRQCLDFPAQYGARPFDHNPGYVWECLERIHIEQQPLLVQPLLSVAAERLAEFAVAPEKGDCLIRQVITPQRQNFYDLLDESVDKGYICSALLAHNVVLEGMAYPI